MDQRRARAIIRILVGLLGLSAIVTQMVAGLGRQTFDLVNFFSFFTIESNVLAAVVYIALGTATFAGRETAHWGMLRGAVTLFMVTTGIVYSLLLSGLEESLQTPIPWVNTVLHYLVLHYLVPLYALVDWVWDPPRPPVPFRRALTWLLFPLAYAVYSLVRGPVVEWYPYPFLDPGSGNQGYGRVLTTSVIIAVALVALVAVLTAINQARAREPVSAPAPTGS